MSSLVINQIKPGFYLDSVALMRLSLRVGQIEGVQEASLMTGTDANRKILVDANLLTDEGAAAGANDLIIALRIASADDGGQLLEAANGLLTELTRPSTAAGEVATTARALGEALESAPDANLALISVPGAFAAREAQKALESGLNAMVFSDNVSIEDEVRLKRLARDKGLLMMGPDCGTALLGGVPIAFANEVPRGVVGAVAASGTGLQALSVLLARAGAGLSHGIGVGGRDLSDRVGGISTLAALDLLEADPATERVVVVSKPPGLEAARALSKRLAAFSKPVVVAFIGAAADDPTIQALPSSVVAVSTMLDAAEAALESPLFADDPFESGESETDGSITGEIPELAARAAHKIAHQQGGPANRVVGLYTGGTLCAEAQVVFRDAALSVGSNAPIPNVTRVENFAATQSGVGAAASACLLDLGDDAYTQGRPHPMIEPTVRSQPLADALKDPSVAVVLLDVMLGYGSHAEPAAAVAEQVRAAGKRRPLVVASVCGTSQDPQNLETQCAALREAGVLLAPTNVHAAHLALALLRQI